MLEFNCKNVSAERLGEGNGLNLEEEFKQDNDGFKNNDEVLEMLKEDFKNPEMFDK